MAMQDDKGRVERIRKVLFDDNPDSPEAMAERMAPQSSTSEESGETVKEPKKKKSESS